MKTREIDICEYTPGHPHYLFSHGMELGCGRDGAVTAYEIDTDPVKGAKSFAIIRDLAEQTVKLHDRVIDRFETDPDNEDDHCHVEVRLEAVERVRFEKERDLSIRYRRGECDADGEPI